MADSSQPDAVNGAVIDAVTATNSSVVAETPTMALGSLYQTIGNSVAMAAINSVYAQQQGNLSSQASNTLGISKLFSQNG